DEVKLVVDPLDPQVDVPPARFPMRTGRRLIVDFEETDLDEVARAALEMQRHPVEMPPELRGREVEERVDRTDRAVEGTSQVKVSHVRFEHFASRSEPPA